MPVLDLLSQTSVAVLIECLVVGLTTVRGASAQVDLCVYPKLLLDTAELLQLRVLIAQVSWRLVGAVATNLQAVRTLLEMQAALVA